MKKAVYIFLIMIFLTGCTVTPIKKVESDGQRFSNEYAAIKINGKNPMIYKNESEIINILKSGTGIIYFGFPDCPWCQSAIPVLLEVAKEMEIDEIYYFNPKEIRANNTAAYQEIIKLLGDNLSIDENGNRRLLVPDVYFVSGGKIVGHHLGTVETQTDPKNSPLTDEQKKELKGIYKRLVSETYNIECDCEDE